MRPLVRVNRNAAANGKETAAPPEQRGVRQCAIIWAPSNGAYG